VKLQKKSVRKWVQLFFFAFIGLIAVNKTISASGGGIPFVSDASLHALCPFGGVVTIYNLAAVGTFVQKIHLSSVVLMILVFLLTILFGPVFCGWVCPLGTVQEWIGKLGRKIFRSKYNHFIPQKIDRYLRYFRYIVLVWVVFVIARSGQLLFEHIDPYNAMFAFWSEEVAIQALIILVITLLLSLFVERPWCKYTCPYGALLGLFNRFRIVKIKRNESTCISCGKCDRSCPMNIPVSQQNTVKNTQCISCLQCTSELHCPVPETVSFNMVRNPKKSISVLLIAVVVFTVIFGGIGIAMAADFWSTSNDRKAFTGTETESSGDITLDSIKGSSTLKDVSDSFDVEIEVLLQAFSVTDAAGGEQMKVKDLESLYGDTELEGRKSVQAFVSLYKGIPYELDEYFLPDRAVDILLESNPQLTQEQIDYLNSHKISSN